MNIQKIGVSFSDGRGDIIDILRNSPVEYATLIRSRKHSVRGNHYHKETYQHVYVLEGKIRVCSQMPGGEREEAVIEAGDLLTNEPHERHAFEALEDSVMLVLTRGPRGGENYESDTYRLSDPLITARAAG